MLWRPGTVTPAATVLVHTAYLPNLDLLNRERSELSYVTGL